MRLPGSELEEPSNLGAENRQGRRKRKRRKGETQHTTQENEAGETKAELIRQAHRHILPPTTLTGAGTVRRQYGPYTLKARRGRHSKRCCDVPMRRKVKCPRHGIHPPVTQAHETHKRTEMQGHCDPGKPGRDCQGGRPRNSGVCYKRENWRGSR